MLNKANFYLVISFSFALAAIRAFLSFSWLPRIPLKQTILCFIMYQRQAKSGFPNDGKSYFEIKIDNKEEYIQ